MSLATERSAAKEILGRHCLVDIDAAAWFLECDYAEVVRMTEDKRLPVIPVGTGIRGMLFDPIDLTLVRHGIPTNTPSREVSEEVMEAGRVRYRALPRSYPVDPQREVVGRVYIMETTEGPSRVKVGFSTNVEQRLHSLRTSSPVGIHLRSSWAADPKVEFHLHRLCAQHRLHGEWFTPEAVEVVERGGGSPRSSRSRRRTS